MPQTLPLATVTGVNTNFTSRQPSFVVVDGFYEDPDAVVQLADEASYHTDIEWFKGERSNERYLFDYVRERFCLLLSHNVTNWVDQPYNGVFQKTTWRDPLVFHNDAQRWAGAVYLNPDSEGMGTSFWSRGGKRDDASTDNPADWTDPSKWEHVETVAGLYNRLVLWDASLIHSATRYEGTRLVQLFFFD